MRDKLKRIANHIAEYKGGDELYWVENETFVVGFDWLSEEVYLIDLEHPDGEVIEVSSLSINRVYDNTEPDPTQTEEQ